MKIFTFNLDSIPKKNTIVNVNLIPQLSDCQYYEGAELKNPSKYVIPNRFQFSNQSTSLTGSFLIKGVPACYQVVVYVSEGTPYMNATAAVSILSAKTPPVPPVLTSVQFSNDGRFLYINFDSSTDKGGNVLKGQANLNFNCSKLLRFASSDNSKCLWQWPQWWRC
jgi:hypothetical protein